jgi:2-succinyl-5-enolpyruvyl-6-hydroxy-3-cyclohexene-1-carboxylate synthase
MLHPTVYNTSEICATYGIRHAVLSPGSRNAPLTISFARNEKIQKWIIPDERSAGFIALGIAQKTNSPVVLCCTSGTALLNYAPAIAEAFYREIPLIVLSADRPPELIDQRDGQTIRQFDALKNHVKETIQLPVIIDKETSEEYQEFLIKALDSAKKLPLGPIHLNVPFKEPFYPDPEQQLVFDSFDTPTDSKPSTSLSISDLILNPDDKVLVLVGQELEDSKLSKALNHLSTSIPIVKSPLNNLHISGIEHVDLFIEDQKELVPDVLITTGLSVLSKKLKQFLRKHKPQRHYHFDTSGIEVDTYGTQPNLIKSCLKDYLSDIKDIKFNPHFIQSWQRYFETTSASIEDFFNDCPFSEISLFHSVLKGLPNNIDLHLGNSMPVRFADMFGVPRDVTTWCNRGTSGIEGVTSTAVGTSLISNKLSVLLTGDVSFLYDRNAFFHNYLLPNLRIIVFNNQGGGIFRLIEGPSELSELEAYFETKHDRTAKHICGENGFEYLQAHDLNELRNILTDFYQPSRNVRVLEVFTDPEINQRIYQSFRKTIHEQIRT